MTVSPITPIWQLAIPVIGTKAYGYSHMTSLNVTSAKLQVPAERQSTQNALLELAFTIRILDIAKRGIGKALHKPHLHSILFD